VIITVGTIGYLAGHSSAPDFEDAKRTQRESASTAFNQGLERAREKGVKRGFTLGLDTGRKEGQRTGIENGSEAGVREIDRRQALSTSIASDAAASVAAANRAEAEAAYALRFPPGQVPAP